ncbi:MFS transporter [Spirosoma aerolatum]|uniref:MFS transporter n=1 Tax=Spirosoma aerolatum TaxID=1211326 RepID=UPI0009ABDB2B|nr:MFS transporter [Spirosoma aerolatum]
MTNYRWRIVGLLFVATTINYLDRQVISLLKPTLETIFNWTETDYSHIVMAFQAAYALSYVVFGRLIDKIGTKVGYVLAVLVWSIAAALHAVATSTFSFGVYRALLGLGEGGNFPAAIKTVAEWFPRHERALATGLFNAGTNIGAVVAPIAVPWLLGVYGWQVAFILTGLIGFIWLFFWWWSYDSPQKHKNVSTQELAFITQDTEGTTDGASNVRWIDLIRRRQTWAFILGKLLTDPVWWFFLFWLPSYFAASFNLDLKKPSLPLIIVYTAATIGSVGGGYLSGYFLNRGWTINRSRKTAMLLYAFCIVPIVLTRYATSIWEVVGLLSLAVAAHQAWSANLFTLVSDMFPKSAVSSVVGLGGMAGSVGGILFPIVVGALLDTYKAQGNITIGYNYIFLMCGSAYVLAWLLIHLFAPNIHPLKGEV